MKCKKIEQGIMFHLDHISPCCQYDLHKPFVGTNESIPTTLEEYKNSKVIQDEIQLMHNDQVPIGCTNCVYNGEGAVNMIAHAEPGEYSFMQLELSNDCNLACRYCHINFSTTGAAVYKKMKGNTNLEEYNLNTKLYTTPRNIRYSYEDIKRINLAPDAGVSITGGEPFKDIELLRELLEILPKDINLHMTTNGTIKIPDDILALLKTFKSIRLMFSIDSIPKYNDYLRTYSDSEVVLRNMKYLMKRHRQIYIGINCTISNITAPHFISFSESLIRRFNKINEFYVHVGYVIIPRYLSIYNLKPEYKLKLIEELSAYIKELDVNHTSPETKLVHGIITGCHSLIAALKRNENEMIHTIDTINECIDVNTNIDKIMKIKNPIDLIAYFKEGQYE